MRFLLVAASRPPKNGVEHRLDLPSDLTGRSMINIS